MVQDLSETKGSQRIHHKKMEMDAYGLVAKMGCVLSGFLFKTCTDNGAERVIKLI